MYRRRVQHRLPDSEDFISQKHMHPQRNTKAPKQMQNAASDVRMLRWPLKGKAWYFRSLFPSCFPLAWSTTPFPVIKLHVGSFVPRGFFHIPQKEHHWCRDSTPSRSRISGFRSLLGLRLPPGTRTEPRTSSTMTHVFYLPGRAPTNNTGF